VLFRERRSTRPQAASVLERVESTLQQVALSSASAQPVAEEESRAVAEFGTAQAN
jgi:hypothetical protein